MSSKRSSEKDHPNDKALDEVNKHIKEAFDILKSETNKLRKERNAFDEVAKKLEHVHFSKMLKLNVGGHFFSTSLTTMTEDSDLTQSLARMDLTSSIEMEPTSATSCIIFALENSCYLTTKLSVKELLTEAEFYQIDGIINELKAKPFKDSAILSSRGIAWDWLKDTRDSLGDDYVLLYKASRDGWDASNFHSCCDNKGPTVTVIESGNCIFGGYTDAQWQSGNGVYKRGPNTFLFSLVNKSGLPSTTKMPLVDGQEENAIYCQSSCGPVFGGGRDLYISNSPNTYYCSWAVHATFQCPVGQNGNTFFTGNQNFYVNEMEVFVFEN